MARREFTKPVYAEIVKRSMVNGKITCEGCGQVLGSKPYHVDHTIADALHLDKTKRLTASDGKLLGVTCCHAPKTKQDVKEIAKAKRREAKHLGIKKPEGKLKSKGFDKVEKSTRRAELPELPRRALYTTGK